MPPKHSYITGFDQFCGCGGNTEGAQRVEGFEVVYAVNHCKIAVETHNTNHPTVAHDCTDISACDPRRYPSTDVLITSPECTTHSPAGGRKRKNQGQLSLFEPKKVDPKIERSRATMWDVVRFTEYHEYNAVIVENVVDLREWQLFESWANTMRTLGYRMQTCHFNSRFFPGVPQSRDRMYMVFTKLGNPAPDLDFRPLAHCENGCGVVESVQSWKNPVKTWGRYGNSGQYVYRCPRCGSRVTPPSRPASDAIDWTLPIKRIGERKEPLKPKTLARIEAGLRRFAGQRLVVSNYSPGWSRPADSSPVGSITTKDHHSVVTPPEAFLTSYYGNGGFSGITSPVPTVTTHDRFGMVCPPFLTQVSRPYAEGERKQWTVDQPTPTQTTRQELAVCVPLVVELRQHQTVRPVTEPLTTVTAGGTHHGLLDVRVEKIEVDPEKIPPVEDCGFRMLRVPEIQAAMAFPPTYRILGTQRDQVRQLGNAVTPPVMEWIVSRVVKSLEGRR